MINVMPAPPMPFLPRAARAARGAGVVDVCRPRRGRRARPRAVPRCRHAAGRHAPGDALPDVPAGAGGPPDRHDPQRVLPGFGRSHAQLILDTLVKQLASPDVQMAIVNTRVLGGAISRVNPDATAYAHREWPLMVNVAAIVSDPRRSTRSVPGSRRWEPRCPMARRAPTATSSRTKDRTASTTSIRPRPTPDSPRSRPSGTPTTSSIAVTPFRRSVRPADQPTSTPSQLPGSRPHCRAT